MSYELEERQIINYLRKNTSNNKNQYIMRNKLLSLFYKTIYNIPISDTVDDYQIILKTFPHYFHNKTREEIIKLFNNNVCPKKPIIYNFNFNNYEIKKDTSLLISTNTFRPIYDDNWKEKTEKLNGTSIINQQSFYAEYLRFYLKFKKFPNFNEFLNYIYYKSNKPVHKDIKIAYDNINNSYNSIKDYININNLTYNFIKSAIINSASIKFRKNVQ